MLLNSVRRIGLVSSGPLKFVYPATSNVQLKTRCQPLHILNQRTENGYSLAKPFQLPKKTGPITYGPVYRMEQTRSISDDKVKEVLDLVKTNLEYVKYATTPALVLGLSGLVPFIWPPLYMLTAWSFSPGMAFCQAAYGATILSFIGGARWGLTLSSESHQPDWMNLGYSVSLPLVAWVALLMSPKLSMLTLVLGLGGSAYMDLTMEGYPTWFKGLRIILSGVAMFMLFNTIILSLLLPDPSKQKPVTEVSSGRRK